MAQQFHPLPVSIGDIYKSDSIYSMPLYQRSYCWKPNKLGIHQISGYITMSTLKTGALRGTSGTADSIQLHASNQSVTFPGDVTFSGTVTGDNNTQDTGLPCFQGENGYNSVQNVSNVDTWNKLDFNQIHDSGNMFDPSTDRFTPTVAGYYFIWACSSDSGNGLSSMVWHVLSRLITLFLNKKRICWNNLRMW